MPFSIESLNNFRKVYNSLICDLNSDTGWWLEREILFAFRKFNFNINRTLYTSAYSKFAHTEYHTVKCKNVFCSNTPEKKRKHLCVGFFVFIFRTPNTDIVQDLFVFYLFWFIEIVSKLLRMNLQVIILRNFHKFFSFVLISSHVM